MAFSVGLSLPCILGLNELSGICFGHQIVGQALGGSCAANSGIWEVGPSTVRLSDVGKRVFGGGKEVLVCPDLNFISLY